MNLIPKKAVAVLMLLSMFGLFGCASDKKAAEKIEEALEQKYGEDFVVEGIGGGYGTMNNNTLKAIVRPKRDPNIRIVAEITKDLKHVYDDYLNVMVARNSTPEVEEIAQQFWPGAKVELANDTGLMTPEHTDLSMSYPEFLSLYPMNRLLIAVYVNGDSYVDANGSMDESGEYQNYLSFANKLSGRGYVSSSVSIRYLSPAYYDQFEKALQSEVSPDYFYTEIEENDGEQVYVTMSRFVVNSLGEVVTSEEEIFERFQIWKTKREQYVSQRADTP